MVSYEAAQAWHEHVNPGLAAALGVLGPLNWVLGIRWRSRLLSLCAPACTLHMHYASLACKKKNARAGLRPKWYPAVEHRKAETFTPKELEEWNQGKVGPHGAELRR